MQSLQDKPIHNHLLQIASIFSADFSAAQRMEIPGTPEYAAFEQELARLQQELETLDWQLRQLLEEENIAFTETLEGVTWGDRLMTLVDSLIQYVAGAFDAGKISAEKQSHYEDIKDRRQKIQAEYEYLKEQAAAMNTVIQSVSSEVSLAANMPLVGGTVIHQAEAWDPETRMYSVGVVLCWSKQLQVAACATLSGEAVEFPEAARGPSMSEWLQFLDYSEAIGPRQFLDDKGRFQMIGISAMPAGRNAPQDTRNRRIAELNAQAMTLLSLFADVEVASASALRSVIREDPSYSRTVSILKESMTQSFTGKSVSGLQPRRRVKTKHNESGRNIHVSVYAINADDAAKAIQMRDANALAAIRVHKEQNAQRISNSALTQRIEAAKSAVADRLGASDLRERTQPTTPADSKRDNVKSRNSREKTATPMPGIFF